MNYNLTLMLLVAPLDKMLIADNKAISVFCFVSDLDNWCYFGTTQNSTQQQHLGGDICLL